MLHRSSAPTECSPESVLPRTGAPEECGSPEAVLLKSGAPRTWAPQSRAPQSRAPQSSAPPDFVSPHVERVPESCTHAYLPFLLLQELPLGLTPLLHTLALPALHAATGSMHTSSSMSMKHNSLSSNTSETDTANTLQNAPTADCSKL